MEEPLADSSLTMWLNDNQSEPSHSLPFRSGSDTLPDVSTVEGQQLRLNNLGYNAGVVDGLMGRKTRAAAKGFQSDNGLDVDGIIGPQTQKKLKQVYQQ
ncbi:MAG: peptidoglycan-binding protein [Ketobacter sp.]|nr:peptidoglycan-binding protein [Ketobacter sp.]